MMVVAPWLLLSALGQADFEPLRFSVVRIESLTEPFSWLSPGQGGGGAVGAALGTGWVVRQDPPLVVTNTHVVRDSGSVFMQLLVHSNQKWPARVVGVCPTFDLALLEFEAPEEVTAALAQKSMALKALPLRDGSVPMGLPAVALGFPLGQQSLKISSGVIAGYEEVDGTICIQSTAPISPGSSGGPLLSEDKLEVVGVNFAKAAHSSAENVNFVIPAWRVQALLQSFDSRKTKGDNSTRALFRVPSADATMVHANDALRATHQCSEGIFVAALGPRSFLAHAEPPVPPGAFLQKVGGIAIDEFGTGHNPQFVAETVKYVDLFFMQPDLEGTVEVETCFGGEHTTHNVSLAWRPAYDRGVQFVPEPHFQPELTQVEVFGDIAVMELTFNHISELLKTRASIARFLHPSMQADNRSALVVVHVAPGSYAAEILEPGDVLASLNGQPVHTLDDYRANFLPAPLRERVAGADAAPAPAPARRLVRRARPNTTLLALPSHEGGADMSDDLAEDLGLTDDFSFEDRDDEGTAGDGEDDEGDAAGNGGNAAGDGGDDEGPGTAVGDDDDDDDDEDGAEDHGRGGRSSDDDSAGKRGRGDSAGNGGGTNGLRGMNASNALGDKASKSNGTVWELRTDDDKVYALFFAPALTKQLLTGELAQARWQLSPAVLAAAEALGLLHTASPFIASVLAGRKASPTLTAVRSELRREVGFLAPAEATDAAAPEVGLRPTVQRSVPLL